MTSVRFEAPHADGIGRLVIDRPDDSVNAIDLDLVEHLAEAVRAARAFSADMSSTLAAPSVSGLELPAVTVPYWRSNTG